MPSRTRVPPRPTAIVFSPPRRRTPVPRGAGRWQGAQGLRGETGFAWRQSDTPLAFTAGCRGDAAGGERRRR